MIKEWFKSNTFWHPVTGDLPSHLLSNIPNHIDMRCIEVIQEARTLWGPFSGNDDPELLTAQALFEHVLDVFSRARIFDPLVRVKDGQSIEQRGPDQISERDLLSHARYEVRIDERYLIKRPIKAYQIYSVFSIHLAWIILKDILVEGQSAEDPHILKKMIFANAFLSKAVEKWKVSNQGRTGGSKSKKDDGFFSAIEYAWRHLEGKKTALSLWTFLKAACATDMFAAKTNIDLIYEEKENKLYHYRPDGTSRKIGYRAFQNYLTDFRKKSH